MKRLRFTWGTAIVLVLIVFAGAMALLVTISFRQSINLEYDDYYPREIAHQTLIDKRNNTAALPEAVTIEKGDGIIDIRFPQIFDRDSLTGTIDLFRPADNTRDVMMLIKTDTAGRQIIPTADLDLGVYIVKIEWEHSGEYYYKEQEIYVSESDRKKK
jgi:nitrogen fixation protein FixH